MAFRSAARSSNEGAKLRLGHVSHPSSRYLPGTALVALCVALATAFGACDIPTEAPSFTISPTIRAPLIFSEGLVFLGPESNGRSALLDTTTARFDSLFSVNAADQSVWVVQTIDDFTFGDLNQLIDPIEVDPEAFAVSIDSYAQQQFSASVTDSIGIQSNASTSAPAAPVLVEQDRVYYPVDVGGVLAVPSSSLLDLSGSPVTEFELTVGPIGDNELTFTLTNNLNEPLTSGNFVAGSTPLAILESPGGTPQLQVPFDRSPAPGESATAVLDLSGRSMVADHRFRLDVGTASGMQPIQSDPSKVVVSADLTPTHYRSYTLSSLGAQPNVNVTRSSSLNSTTRFDGFVSKTGTISVTVHNDLPVDFTVNGLRIENAVAFEQNPAGHVVASSGGHFVPALGSTNILISLGQAAVASSIDVIADASSGGSSSPLRLTANDGLRIDVAAAVDLQRIHVRPNGESVGGGSSVAFNAQDVLFVGSDYVEIASGWLELENIVNEYDLTLTSVDISFPTVLRAPFGPGDSLVVSLNGGLPRQSAAGNQSVDLAGYRVYAGGNTLPYNVHAVAEVSAATRVLDFDDQVRGSVRPRSLMPSQLSATVFPFSVPMNVDANGDGGLDILSDVEAEVSAINELDDLRDLGIDGLRVAGAELSIDIATDIAADFVLYGAIAGVSPSGEVVYLSGSGPNGVSPSDTMAQGFFAGGQLLAAERLIRIDVTGASAAGKLEKRNVLLNDANSNVGDFLGALPDELRFVGRALVQPDGGPVHLRDPFVLDAALAIAIPLAIRDSFTVDHTFSADLTSLEDLADPSSRLDIAVADLNLDYENGIPLGMTARFEFLDEFGDVTYTLPEIPNPAMAIEAAVADDLGYSLTSQTGTLFVPVDSVGVRALSRSRDVRMLLSIQASDGAVGRVRANDELAFSLSGNFQINVTIGE